MYCLFNTKANFRKTKGQIISFFLSQWRIFPEVLYKTVFDELIHFSYNEKINMLHTFILFKHIAKHFATYTTVLGLKINKLPING